MKKILLFFCATLLLSYPAFAENKDGLYSYPNFPGMDVGAVFGTAQSEKQDDELLFATSPICDHIEIHKMSEVDGIMKMRQIPSLPLSSTKGFLTLTPDGYHLMLMKLKKDLKKDDVFPITLTFKKAGDKTFDVHVIGRSNAKRIYKSNHD